MVCARVFFFSLELFAPFLHRWEESSDSTFSYTPEKETRDKAVEKLSTFLSAGRLEEEEEDEDEEGNVDGSAWEEWSPDSRLTEKELAKLWKGLFYCECPPPCFFRE
jgi:hypothetical protein